MVSSTKAKMVDSIVEVLEPVLYHNEKDTPMYGDNTEEYYDAKKVMGEVSSLLSGNGLCDLLCERVQERNFKCTTGETHGHIWKYLWDGDDTTVEMTS